MRIKRRYIKIEIDEQTITIQIYNKKGWVGRGALMLSYITILLGMWTITAPLEFAVGFVLLLMSYAFLFGFLDVIKIKEVGLSQFFSLRTSHATIQDEYKTVY